MTAFAPVIRWLLRTALSGILPLALLFSLNLSSAAQPVGSGERIELFDSRLEVEASGDFLVTETIRVVALGHQIRRGIYRDFPIMRRYPNGLIKRYGFEVLEVSRDGQPEAWHEVRKDGQSRVYIGDEDKFLRSGTYTYRLTYRSTHQLRKADGFDEVYWNVTGNDWRLPIRRVRSTIILPDKLPVTRHSFYTGKRGEQGKHARVISTAPGEYQVETTQTLGRGEGLTVAVAIPQASVAGAQTAKDGQLADNFGLLVYGLTPLVLFVYLLWAWHRVGRDPPQGLVIPRFAPPDGLSPAAASYLYYWGAGVRTGGASRALVAALMSLAVKGRLKMDRVGKQIELSRTDLANPENASAQTPLPAGEQALVTSLLTTDRVVLDKTNKSIVSTAVVRFDRALKAEYGEGYFRNNYSWLIPGLLIVGVGLLMVFLTWLPSEAHKWSTAFVLANGLAGFILTVSGYRMLTGGLPGYSTVGAWLRVAFGLAILVALIVVFVVAPVVWPEMTSSYKLDAVSAFMAAVALLLAGLCVLMHALLFAPTERGREIADEIAGFRQYLSVAEGERMNLHEAPDFSTELFERFLPYAIGLGVEKPWAKTLELHLSRSMSETKTAYRPRFYSGSDFNSSDLSTSTASIASSLGSSLASAMPSQSGSSGSGSSGGGGGGGGGGGW